MTNIRLSAFLYFHFINTDGNDRNKTGEGKLVIITFIFVFSIKYYAVRIVMIVKYILILICGEE
jgi:hypothetical protein